MPERVTRSWWVVIPQIAIPIFSTSTKQPSLHFVHKVFLKAIQPAFCGKLTIAHLVVVQVHRVLDVLPVLRVLRVGVPVISKRGLSWLAQKKHVETLYFELSFVFARIICSVCDLMMPFSSSAAYRSFLTASTFAFRLSTKQSWVV